MMGGDQQKEVDVVLESHCYTATLRSVNKLIFTQESHRCLDKSLVENATAKVIEGCSQLHS